MFEGDSIKSNDVVEGNYDVLWSTANSVPGGLYTNASHCNRTSYIQCFNRSDFNYSKWENGTEVLDRPFDLLMGVTSVVLGLIILITVIGNVFVIAAILLERNLQNVANYLIVSLAVADLMVACLVMPLGAVYEIMKGWVLGPELCDMWTSCDVLCCTASILHLVAIAIDRYWAVTDVDYIHTRNVNKIGVMIIMVWTVALIVSLAPQFGWKDPDYLDRINSQKRCLVSQDVAYQVPPMLTLCTAMRDMPSCLQDSQQTNNGRNSQPFANENVFATCSTFYVPLLVILILYWKIFQTARKRIRKNRKSKHLSNTASVASSENTKSPPSFLPKKKLRSFKRSSKQSSATRALVSSLNITEGFSTTTVDAVLPDDATESQKSFDIVTDTSRPDERPQPKKFHQFEGEITTAFTISKSKETEKATSPEKSSEGVTTNNGSASHQSHISDLSRIEILQPDTAGVTKYGTATATAKAVNPMQVHKEKKESLEAKRERKAAKTLAIITGAFVICWLPFFIMALMMPLFGPISDHLASFFLWLGYFNSTLNPVIYTVFSPEFRQAFKRILFGAPRRNPHYRPGKWR